MPRQVQSEAAARLGYPGDLASAATGFVPMREPPSSDGLLHKTSANPGAATRTMAYARAREIALRGGRQSSEVSQSDSEQAKRDVTGESDADRQDGILDEPAEATR